MDIECNMDELKGWLLEVSQHDTIIWAKIFFLFCLQNIMFLFCN